MAIGTNLISFETLQMNFPVFQVLYKSYVPTHASSLDPVVAPTPTPNHVTDPPPVST